MRVHPLIPALLIAAVLGGALLWSARSAAETTPPADIGLGPDALPAPIPDGESAAAPDPRDPSTREAAADDRSSEREVVPTVDAPLLEGPLVTVVRGEPPQPVPGIRVAWVDRDAARGRLGRRSPIREAAAQDDFDLAQRFGQSAATDSKGQLRLPPLRAMTVISSAAAENSEFAGAIIAPDHGDVTLRLYRDETVQVLVKDQRGQPARDVPVILAQGRKWQEANFLWFGHSDDDGVARARHFQLLRRGRRQGDRFAAALALALPTPVAVEFSGQPPPAAPLELQLPPTTAIDIAIVHASGPPLLAAASVQLRPARDEKFALPLPLPDRFETPRLQKELGSEPIRLTHVGAAVDVTPFVRVADQRPFALPAVRLPVEPAGVVPLRLLLPPELSVLAATAMLGSGQPLALAGVQWSLAAPRGGITGSAQTLADGRFDFVWRNRDVATPWQLDLRWVDGDGQALGARIQLGTQPIGGYRDLKTVTLEPLPVLARGSLVDDRSAPVADVSIALQRFGPGRRGDSWQEVPLINTSSDRDGRFTLAGPVPPGSLRLAFRKDGHLPLDSAPITPIAQLDLCLVRVGQLRGIVLLPEWLPDGAASIHLRSLADRDRQYGDDVRRGGQFQLGDLAPDVYEATVSLRNLPEPLAVLGGLRIEPGPQRDPRLDPLDLRALLHRYRLRAIGPGGQLLPQVEGPILWRRSAPSGEATHTAFRWQKGRAELITTQAFLELVTVPAGHAITRLSLAPGDHDVYLQPLNPVLVDVPGLRAIAGLDRAVRVSMILKTDVGLPQGISGLDQQSGESYSFARWQLGKSNGGWLDTTDRAEVPLAVNGRYEVVLRLYADKNQQGPQTSVPAGEVDVVVDGLGPTHHTLAFDRPKAAAALAALLQQVQQRNQQRNAPATR